MSLRLIFVLGLLALQGGFAAGAAPMSETSALGASETLIRPMKILKAVEPTMERGEVVFRIEVSNARNVFLAGTFNDWAHNRGGFVDDPAFAMARIGDTLYEKRMRMAPGPQKFKFVINNNQWFAPPGYEKDGDGNIVIYVSADQKISRKPEVIRDPHRSFYELPFSNGFSSAKFNRTTKTVDSFKNHIYSNWNEQVRSENLVRTVDVWITDTNGTRRRLSDLNLESAEYLNGTGIVKAVFSLKDHAFTAYYFCSFLKDHNNLTAVVSLPKDGGYRLSHAVELAVKKDVWMNEKQDTGYYRLVVDHFPGDTKLPAGLTGEPPQQTLQNEISYWNEWRRLTRYPPDLSPDRKALYDQSLAVLKMGQCREPGKSHGQILASLPPGMWNICWIRDAAYAVNGLILANHLQESKEAIEFFLNADCGKYASFKVDGREVGVGMPYQISVCRYFGSGEEESDGGDDPNIELDGFGLFLWILDSYVEQSGDTPLLNQYWNIVSGKIADVLVHSVDPEVQLIRKESSIWERHIRDNGRENGARYYTYSTITAIHGLAAARRMAGRTGDLKAAEKYKRAGESLTGGFFKHQIDSEKKVIKNSKERTDIGTYLDAAVIEAINFGVVDPGSDYAVNTIRAFDEFLPFKTRDNGYFRNLDGTHYDRQEWIVIDLRIAAALKKMNQRDRAEKLIQWVVDQSKLNDNLIAELYNEDTANYEGAVPMCGFGPGAYIASLWDR